MMIIEIDFSTFSGMGIPVPINKAVKGSEKLSAAKALFKKPDRVIATYMVAKNLDGWFVSFESLTARLSPSPVIFFNFELFMEMTAISALAKIAFSTIKIISKITDCNIGYVSFLFL